MRSILEAGGQGETTKDRNYRGGRGCGEHQEIPSGGSSNSDVASERPYDADLYRLCEGTLAYYSLKGKARGHPASVAANLHECIGGPTCVRTSAPRYARLEALTKLAYP
jgi:hypothetical protein